MRGEDVSVRIKARALSETPPLARGRLNRFLQKRLHAGNTPACAGKTRRFSSRWGVVRKHPRLRGEDKPSANKQALTEETPPLARGRRLKRFLLACVSGNTPACAGKTAVYKIPATLTWKHPRLRGEDLDGPSASRYVAETPPLARGRRGKLRRQTE